MHSGCIITLYIIVCMTFRQVLFLLFIFIIFIYSFILKKTGFVSLTFDHAIKLESPLKALSVATTIKCILNSWSNY